MTKKIVAVGGGENGRLKSDGTRTMYPYELEKMDKEIIKLTKKEHPNFLLIAHSQPLERQEVYFQTMVDIYGKLYNCHCKDLKSNELNDKNKVKELIDWADIIYEGGGDTLMCTYSVPIYRFVNGQRFFIGVLTMDISLTSFEKIVKSIKIQFLMLF